MTLRMRSHFIYMPKDAWTYLWNRQRKSVNENLFAAYDSLHKEGIVPDEELPLEAWLEDCDKLQTRRPELQTRTCLTPTS